MGVVATALAFSDGALSKIALHNSFEHFEGDSDIRFLREAARVLRPKGKVCIVPLFVGLQFRIETEAGWIDEQGKKHLWGVGARFSRTYDPASLDERVLKNCHDFDVTWYIVENAYEIDAGCYLRYFLLLEKRGETGETSRAGGPLKGRLSAAMQHLLRRGRARLAFWGRRLMRPMRAGRSR